MTTAEQAWTAYAAGLENLRQRLFALDCAQEEEGQAQACRLLLEAQASAHNLILSQNAALPRLQTHTVFTPGVYDWMMPNPDFLYRYAFLDPGGRYRLVGTMGDTAFSDIQTIARFFGDPDLKLMDTFTLRNWYEPGSAIDIPISRDRPAGDGPWIRLADDAVTTLILRECFSDWASERGGRFEIVTDQPAATPLTAKADLSRDLESCLRMLDFCIAAFGPEFCQSVRDRAGENHFLHVDTSRDEDAANPGVAYVPAAYNIAPDEALVITFTLPDARYWSMHLTDRWSRTLDYASRQNSLNGSQAVATDGTVHIVVSAHDPGVHNWLDTTGLQQGMLLLRWYAARQAPVPQVQRVPLSQLQAILPTHAQRITANERAETLRQRARAVARRHSF